MGRWGCCATASSHNVMTSMSWQQRLKISRRIVFNYTYNSIGLILIKILCTRTQSKPGKTFYLAPLM
jgi:hypothetical protein